MVDVLSLLFMALKMFIWIVKAMLLLTWCLLEIFVKMLPFLIKGTVLLIGIAIILLKLLFAFIANLFGAVEERIAQNRRQKLTSAPVAPVAIAETWFVVVVELSLRGRLKPAAGRFSRSAPTFTPEFTVCGDVEFRGSGGWRAGSDDVRNA